MRPRSVARSRPRGTPHTPGSDRRRIALPVVTALVGMTVATATPGAVSVAGSHLAATTSAVGFSQPCVAAAMPSTYDHLIWIWFENKPSGSVIGSSAAPYFTSLAGQCGWPKNYHATTHPSLPNYLAATGGDTFGVTDDNPPSSHPISDPSIFSQVTASGRQWRSYEESMPSNCTLTSPYPYAVKHNPAAYFTSIYADCMNWDVPMGTTSSGAFLNAVTGGTLPAFSFVTPNLCNDMHDCSVATGDAWLKAWMTKILDSATYAAGRTGIVVTFDESATTDPTNTVSTILVSPSVIPGSTDVGDAGSFNHYSLLRTTEEMLGLPKLRAAVTASSMRWKFRF